METIQEEFKNAPFWKRLIGLLIDSSIIFLLVLTVTGEFDNPSIGYTIGSFLGSLATGPILTSFSLLNNSSSIDITVFIMLLIYYTYCLLSELAFKNTFGKFIVGLKIISIKTGLKPSNIQIIGRTFCRMIPFDVFSFFAKNPRGWHDSIPNTIVTTIKSRRIYKTGNTRLDYSSANFLQKGIIKLKSLKKGIYRLIITLSIFLPLIVAIIAESNARYSDGKTFFGVLVLGIVIYWILIFVGIWINEGFEDE